MKVIGASFDPPDANLAFAQKYDYFGTLLSDADRRAGRDYETAVGPLMPDAAIVVDLAGYSVDGPRTVRLQYSFNARIAR